MVNPVEVTPLSRVDRSGINPDAAGIEFSTFENLAICQVFAQGGGATPSGVMQASVAESLGISGEPGQATVTDHYTALPLSPGQWMLHSESGRDGSFCENLRSRLGQLGYVSEQSHGRIIIRVGGRNARDLLQKGCRLDLHPSIVSAGFCAQTPIAQTGVLMHLLDEKPTYELMLYAGFAQSFWHWLTESAAQYGYRVI